MWAEAGKFPPRPMLLLLCCIRRQVVVFRHAYPIDSDVLAVALIVLRPPLPILVDGNTKSIVALFSVGNIDVEVKVSTDRSSVPDRRSEAQVTHPAAIFRKAFVFLIEKLETSQEIEHLLDGEGARVASVPLECQHELHAEFALVTVEVAWRLEDVPRVVRKVENDVSTNLHAAEDAACFMVLHRHHHVIEGGFVATATESHFLLQREV